jgi:hypothetical protein
VETRRRAGSLVLGFDFRYADFDSDLDFRCADLEAIACG